MTDILPAIETGQIKGLWLIATNPMTSMPNTPRIRKTLENSSSLSCRMPTATSRPMSMPTSTCPLRCGPRRKAA